MLKWWHLIVLIALAPAAFAQDTVPLNLAVSQRFPYSSPRQTAHSMSRFGAEFTDSTVNPAKNRLNYLTVQTKALNAGIYWADMNYCVVYNRTQQSMFAVAAFRRLSDDLGLEFIPESLLIRFENNIDNADSLLGILHAHMMLSCRNMEGNGDHELKVSSLLSIGSWIEDIWFMSLAAQSANDTVIDKLFAAQAKMCEAALAFIIKYGDEDDRKLLIKDLKQLKKVIGKVSITYNYEKPETGDKITVLHTTYQVKMTDRQKKKLINKIELLRNRIINGN